jgi:hypothetical protein
VCKIKESVERRTSVSNERTEGWPRHRVRIYSYVMLPNKGANIHRSTSHTTPADIG